MDPSVPFSSREIVPAENLIVDIPWYVIQNPLTIFFDNLIIMYNSEVRFIFKLFGIIWASVQVLKIIFIVWMCVHMCGVCIP